MIGDEFAEYLKLKICDMMIENGWYRVMAAFSKSVEENEHYCEFTFDDTSTVSVKIEF